MVEDEIAQTGRFFVHKHQGERDTTFGIFPICPTSPSSHRTRSHADRTLVDFKHNFRVQPVKNARPWHACIKGTSVYMHKTFHMVTRAAVRACQIIRPHVRPTLGWRARGCALVQKRKKRRFYFLQRKPYPYPTLNSFVCNIQKVNAPLDSTWCPTIRE